MRWEIYGNYFPISGNCASFLIQYIFIQSQYYGNILAFPIIFPWYEILHYPYSADYLSFVTTSNFLKNPQPRNDMAFQRIYPFYRNLYIPKHWELHGFSLTLHLRGSEEYGKSLCFPILFP